MKQVTLIDDPTKRLNLGPPNYGTYIGDYPPEDWSTAPRTVPLFVQPELGKWYPATTIVASRLEPTTSGWRVVNFEGGMSATIDLPGCRLENIELDIGNGILRVRARRGTGEGYMQHDLAIGTHLDEDSVQATLEDGVLTVIMACREVGRRRQITVRRP